MYNRLTEYAEKRTGDYQKWFCKNSSTADNRYMLRQIMKNPVNLILNCIYYL